MDWSYVTGYFDGEGNVLVRRSVVSGTKLQVSITWFNNHEVSLEAIRDFIGCGRMRSRKKAGANTCYLLQVSGTEDLQRVIPKMLPHSIIKRDKLEEALEAARTIQPMVDRAPAWGSLAAAGPEEIGRLYWEEELTQAEVAALFGVTDSAVKLHMRRNGIPARTQSEAMALAMTDPEKLDRLYGPERNQKVSDAQKRRYAR